MAQFNLEIDLSEAVDEGLISSLVDLVSGFKRYRRRVLLRLLLRDQVTRDLLADFFGQRATDMIDAGDFTTPWEDVMVEAVNHVAALPEDAE